MTQKPKENDKRILDHLDDLAKTDRWSKDGQFDCSNLTDFMKELRESIRKEAQDRMTQQSNDRVSFEATKRSRVEQEDETEEMLVNHSHERDVCFQDSTSAKPKKRQMVEPSYNFEPHHIPETQLFPNSSFTEVIKKCLPPFETRASSQVQAEYDENGMRPIDFSSNLNDDELQIIKPIDLDPNYLSNYYVPRLPDKFFILNAPETKDYIPSFNFQPDCVDSSTKDDLECVQPLNIPNSALKYSDLLAQMFYSRTEYDGELLGDIKAISVNHFSDREDIQGMWSLVEFMLKHIYSELFDVSSSNSSAPNYNTETPGSINFSTTGLSHTISSPHTTHSTTSSVEEINIPEGFFQPYYLDKDKPYLHVNNKKFRYAIRNASLYALQVKYTNHIKKISKQLTVPNNNLTYLQTVEIYVDSIHAHKRHFLKDRREKTSYKFWAVVYYLYRSGKFTEIGEYMNKNKPIDYGDDVALAGMANLEKDRLKVDDHTINYFDAVLSFILNPKKKIGSTQRKKLERAIKFESNRNDLKPPNKYLIYILKLVSGKNLDSSDFPEGIQSIDDKLWYKLEISRENINKNMIKSRYSLLEVQNEVKAMDPEFRSNNLVDNVVILLMTGQFELAVYSLSCNKHYNFDGFILGLALSRYGLLHTHIASNHPILQNLDFYKPISDQILIEDRRQNPPHNFSINLVLLAKGLMNQFPISQWRQSLPYFGFITRQPSDQVKFMAKDIFLDIIYVTRHHNGLFDIVNPDFTVKKGDLDNVSDLLGIEDGRSIYDKLIRMLVYSAFQAKNFDVDIVKDYFVYLKDFTRLVQHFNYQVGKFIYHTVRTMSMSMKLNLNQRTNKEFGRLQSQAKFYLSNLEVLKYSRDDVIKVTNQLIAIAEFCTFYQNRNLDECYQFVKTTHLIPKSNAIKDLSGYLSLVRQLDQNIIIFLPDILNMAIKVVDRAGSIPGRKTSSVYDSELEERARAISTLITTHPQFMPIDLKSRPFKSTLFLTP